MPAHAFEIDEAEEEGIKIHWLRIVKGLEGSTMRVEKMRHNAQGQPEPTGQLEALKADTRFLKHVPGLRFNQDGSV